MGKAWEHSSREWTQGGCRGGGADIQIYMYWTWKWVSYHSRRVVSITLRSGVRKQGRTLERMVLCVVLAVGPLPPLTSTSRPPDVIHMMNAPRPSPFKFLSIFRFRVLLWTQMGDENGGGLTPRLTFLSVQTSCHQLIEAIPAPLEVNCCYSNRTWVYVYIYIEMACYMYGHLASHHTEMFYVKICYTKVYDAGI